MSADAEAFAFLQQMVEQLDETIRDLAKREQALVTVLGAERTEELRELWNQTLEREDELALRSSMDWRDKELLWVWSRQRRAHSTRANAGQAFMRHGSMDGGLDVVNLDPNAP